MYKRLIAGTIFAPFILIGSFYSIAILDGCTGLPASKLIYSVGMLLIGTIGSIWVWVSEFQSSRNR
jgi:hypothetical protein